MFTSPNVESNIKSIVEYEIPKWRPNTMESNNFKIEYGKKTLNPKLGKGKKILKFKILQVIKNRREE